MDVLISIARDSDPANYVRAVEKAGGRAHAAYLPKPNAAFDGLILAGGGDVEPSLFGERNLCSTNIDLRRDRAELALLDAFARAGKPVLGICRGHQVVNVWAGGGVIQDLGERNAIHRWEEGDKTHMILTGEGVLRELYGPRFRSNSAHHQGVGPVGRGMRVTARSADGIIEAMEHRCLPILTVQFHPERMVEENTAEGDPVFRHFLSRCHCISRGQGL